MPGAGRGRVTGAEVRVTFMSRNFSWQTDEEEWAATETASARERRAVVRPALVLAALLLLGGIAFWQVNAHLNRVAQRTEEEVLASYRLVEAAAQARDSEVLDSFLSRRDEAWARSQTLLAERGMLLAARFFGLQPAGSTLAPDVQLVPDLSEAEVVVMRSYTTSGEDGSIETVRMQERFDFRRGTDRWLWAASESAYWGERVHTVYEHVSLTYPEGDAEIAGLLGADLNRLAGRLCRELAEVTCPPGYRIRVRLEPDAATLLQLSDWQAHLDQGNAITLPAPGLIGRPVDDGAYQALWRGYARYFAAPVLAELTGYRCCDRAHSFQHTLETRLSRLGVGWPAPPRDLPGGAVQLYCVARTTARQVLFAYEPRSDTWQDATWLPEDLVAVQQVPLAGGAWLVRDGNRRVLLFDGEQQIVVAESPRGGGVIYALAERDPTRTKVTIQVIDRAAKATSYMLFDLKHCGGDACPLQPLSGRPIWSADGEYTINYRDEAAGAGRREGFIFLGDGDGEALTAAPAISRPDESFSFPVWLDGDTYAFIRHQGSGAGRRPEVVFTQAATGERLKTLAIEDLLAPIPQGERPSRLLVNQMRADPLDPAGLLLRVSSADNSMAYHLLVNWRIGRAQVLAEPFDRDVWAYPSPDGHRLALYEREPGVPGRWTLGVFERDLEERRLIGRTVPDLTDGPLWSGDGKWLTNSYSGFLSLIAVDSGYSHVTEIPDDASCRPLQWVAESGRRGQASLLAPR